MEPEQQLIELQELRRKLFEKMMKKKSLEAIYKLDRQITVVDERIRKLRLKINGGEEL